MRFGTEPARVRFVRFFSHPSLRRVKVLVRKRLRASEKSSTFENLIVSVDLVLDTDASQFGGWGRIDPTVTTPETEGGPCDWQGYRRSPVFAVQVGADIQAV